MADAGPFDCVIDMICFTPEQAESTVRAFAGRTKHVIFCSTVDVYSKPIPVYPYREDAPRDAVGDYGINKVKCEDIFLDAHRRGDFAATNIRPAHTYGDPGALVHAFGWSNSLLDRIRKGKPVIVHGDGSSLWASAHADDVAGAFVGAICNDRAYGKSYHATGEEPMPWNHYHATIAEALGAPPPTLAHIPSDLLAKVAPDRTWVVGINFQFNNIFDNTAARNDLGYRYTIPLLEGARRTIAYQEAHGGFENSDDDVEYDRIIAAWDNLGTEMARTLVASSEDDGGDR
jgi:nucleoside-diphosphate-sugar epimerase